jgi:hypothetical protein
LLSEKGELSTVWIRKVTITADQRNIDIVLVQLQKVMQHVEAHEYHDCHVISSHYSHLTCNGVTKSCSYLKKLLKRNDGGRLKTSVSDPMPPGNSNINVNVEALECAICLSAYQIGETVALSKLKNGCTHVFHYDCILEWGINGHSLCPVCRAPFWSNDRKNVAMCRKDSPEERMQCTALLYQLLVRRHHPVEQSASNDIIVEVHIDGAAAQPNESVEPMSTAESTGKGGHREHNIEQSQFCVIHGLIASAG